MGRVIELFSKRQQKSVATDAGAVTVERVEDKRQTADILSAPLPSAAIQTVTPLVDPIALVLQALMFYAGNGRVEGQGQDGGKKAREALGCLAKRV